MSGAATPGSAVRVIVNGIEVHSFTVDGSGQFAEFVTLPFSDAARALVLETVEGGQVARSDDYLIAAVPEPEQPAEQVAKLEAAESADAGDGSDEPAPAEATDGASAESDTAEAANEATEQAVVAHTASEATPEPDKPAEPDVPVENNQIAVLRSGEEGVELLQAPSRPDAPTSDQVALDTIGYSSTGNVRLSGRARDGSVVRLYLNNRLINDLTPDAQGRWRGELEGIDPGVYTLRLDEVDPQGTVLSRVETPFKREAVEALQPPAATASGDAATPAPAIRAITVQEGDTLWAISRERYGDGFLFVKVFEANREAIRDPDLIYPGQIFTIPD